MALNRTIKQNEITLYLPVESGTVSGGPVCVGKLPGVALGDRDTDGKAVIQIDGVFTLSVEAKNDSGVSGADANSAVAVGDKLYWATGDTPKVSKRTDGTPFGIALSTLTSGSTGSVSVQIGHTA